MRDILIGMVRDWSLLSLSGLALVAVFKATGVFNLAQGSLMLLDIYVATTLDDLLGSPWLTLVGILLLQIPVGLLLSVMLRREMARQAVWSAAIIMLGVGLAVGAIASHFYKSATLRADLPVSGESPIDGLATTDLFAFVLAWIVLVAVVLGQRTRSVGLPLRMTGENPLLASQSGIHIMRVFTWSWIAGLAVAALAGLLYSYSSSANPGVVALGLGALAPAILGGLDSLGGVFAGAAVAALVQQLALHHIGGDAANFALFTLVLVALLVRPHGLFGTAAAQRA